jgi:hypothetical protein
MLTSMTTDVPATDARRAYVNDRMKSAETADPRVPSTTISDVKTRRFDKRPSAYRAEPE